MPINIARIEGIVLAGGQSRRFGKDKALADFDGKKMIERSVRLLEEAGLPVTVVAPMDREYGFLNRRMIPDLIAGQGPLGGLQAAFSAYPGKDLLVLSCDMPRLRAESVKLLLDEKNAQADAVIYTHGENQWEPFPGLYRAQLAGLVGIELAQNQRSMKSFLEKVTMLKEVVIQNQNEFVNLNYPSDSGVD